MLTNLLSFASTMKSFGGILLAVVILLAMVTIHEFGHYIAGKLLGFRINEFAVGFGPAIFKKRSKKTGELFALRCIPLGGYCAFDGEDEFSDEETKQESNPDDEPFAEMTVKEENEGGMSATNQKTDEKTKAEEEEYPQPKGARFNDQKPWKRIIVLLAGATMNYLLSVLLIILLFATVGRPVYQVVKDAPKPENESLPNVMETYETGLQTGDVILEVEGKTVYLYTDYIKILDGKKAGDKIDVLVLREEQKKTVEITLIEDAKFANMSDISTLIYSLGLATRGEVDGEVQTTRGGGFSTTHYEDGFFQTIGKSFVYSVKIGGTVLRSLGELLTGKMGLEAMGGPVTTIKVTSEVAASGWENFLNIAAFIGVNLAVFNLLPIPALDGCKAIFCLIEWIRKKPINRKVETIIHLAGIIFLFGFAILVDILQLF